MGIDSKYNCMAASILYYEQLAEQFCIQDFNYTLDFPGIGSDSVDYCYSNSQFSRNQGCKVKSC